MKIHRTLLILLGLWSGVLSQGVTAIANPGIDQTLEQIEQYSTLDQQGAGAAQFQDVAPRDWAFQALDELSQRYDCLKGYPDGLFRGERILSRYEFAAGLNACWQQIERLLSDTTSEFVIRDDLEIFAQLRNEFATELENITTGVNNLESRVAFLEDNQFSITTKLEGEVIFALTDVFGASFTETTSNLGFVPGLQIDLTDEVLTFLQTQLGQSQLPDANINVDNDGATIFGARGYINFHASFSGRDRLTTRIAATNLFPFPANSKGVIQAPALPPLFPQPVNAQFTRNSGEAAQTFNVSDGFVGYYFPAGPAEVLIAANRAIWGDVVPMINPYFDDNDGGNGALSTFATANPIYRIGGGAGLGVTIPTKQVQFSAGYLSDTASRPDQGGLFRGEYAMLGQIDGQFGDLALGLTYVHGYHLPGKAIFDRGVGNNGLVGTVLANFPGSTLQTYTRPVFGYQDAPMVTNSYGIEAAWAVNDSLSISGFFSYTDAILIEQGNSEIWTYGAGIALPNFLGKQDSLLGFFFGAQPYAGEIKIPNITYRNNATPFHFEAFYRYPLHDRISITPGLIWLFAANEFNNDVVIGTIRTTFSF